MTVLLALALSVSRDLTIPPGLSEVRATRLSPNGEWASGSGKRGVESVALVWNAKGEAKEIPRFDRSRSLNAFAVANTGEVVGASPGATETAWAWNAKSGTRVLQGLSTGQAISADGARIGGYVAVKDGAQAALTGLGGLAKLPFPTFGRPSAGVSYLDAVGKTAAGDGLGTRGYETFAWRWTQGSKALEQLPGLDPAAPTRVAGLSADGKIALGVQFASGQDRRILLWDATGRPSELANPPITRGLTLDAIGLESRGQLALIRGSSSRRSELFFGSSNEGVVPFVKRFNDAGYAGTPPDAAYAISRSETGAIIVLAADGKGVPYRIILRG